MKSGIMTVFRKELARFFGDKRMVFTVLLLPGLMIYLMYSIMGTAFTNLYAESDATTYTVWAIHLPESIHNAAAGQTGLIFEQEQPANIDAVKEAIAAKEKTLCVVFPENFDEVVANYAPGENTIAPNVEIYFNSSDPASSGAYDRLYAMLDAYESSLSNRFDINRGGQDSFDLADSKDTTGMLFSSMMPMLLMIFLFSGCMAIAPESIAGEKERGTIAALLVTPIKRSEIAVGKIMALSVLALLSGVSSTAGTILSLPKLMGGFQDGFSADLYSGMDYLLLCIVILSTVLLLVALISIISAYAKTVKEAQTTVTPLMIVVILIGVTAMFGAGAKSGVAAYLIPLYNSVQCMIGLFSFQFVPINLLITVACNLVYTGICVYCLTKMFQSEKIMFSR